MQAQTSLVVVGSADDALRVGKTKRQIEGVTQAMVDNMIIVGFPFQLHSLNIRINICFNFIKDEVSEFTATCIINPPSPRDLNAENAANNKITNGTVAKGIAIGSAISKKRKGSELIEGIENALPKPKTTKMAGILLLCFIFYECGFKKKVFILVGRPRNPEKYIPKVTPKSLAQQPSTEALNMAIQSILPATSAPSMDAISEVGEIISTFEVLPNNDLKPIPTQPSVYITSKSSIPPPPPILQNRSMQKIKVMPNNQFVKIKPPNPNTQQMYTVKPNTPVAKQMPLYTIRTQTSSINSNTDVNRTNKVFTVKSTPTGTQLLSTPNQPIKSQLNIVKQASGSPHSPSPKKFTIVKQQSPQLTSPQMIKLNKPPADLSSANIFDIPIVFADKDGNIQDTTPSPSTNSPTITMQSNQSNNFQQIPNTLGSVVISAHPSTSNPLQNRNIIINTINSKPNPGNKVVLINRPIKGQSIQIGGSMSHMTMLPVNSIVNTAGGSGTTMQKFTKVNVSNASSINLPIRTNIEVRPTTMANFKPGTFTLGNKVEILNNQIVKSSNMSPLRQSSGFTNLAGGLMTPTTIISPNSNIAKYNPIVINVDSDKTTIKNMIKVGDTQIKPSNTIVIKPGSLRPMLKPGILNRNVTVRKVVNLVPQTNKSGMTVSLQPQQPQIGTQIVLQASQLQQMANPSPTSTSASSKDAKIKE